MKQLFSNHSIARRLQLGVGFAAGLVLGLTVWFNYRASREELERQINAKAVIEVRAAADDREVGQLLRAAHDIRVGRSQIRLPDSGIYFNLTGPINLLPSLVFHSI
jgi:hypothetical protein